MEQCGGWSSSLTNFQFSQVFPGKGRIVLNSVTRSRDFARKWRFLEAARALKVGPRALREFFKPGAFWDLQNFYVVKNKKYFEKIFRKKFQN